MLIIEEEMEIAVTATAVAEYIAEGRDGEKPEM